MKKAAKLKKTYMLTNKTGLGKTKQETEGLGILFHFLKTVNTGSSMKVVF